MNPDMLKQLMGFLAGMGFPTLMSNLEKMKKIFGAEEGQKPGQQQPGGPQGASPGAGGAPSPQGAAPPQLAALAALMKARMGGAA